MIYSAPSQSNPRLKTARIFVTKGRGTKNGHLTAHASAALFISNVGGITDSRTLRECNTQFLLNRPAPAAVGTNKKAHTLE